MCNCNLIIWLEMKLKTKIAIRNMLLYEQRQDSLIFYLLFSSLFTSLSLSLLSPFPSHFRSLSSFCLNLSPSHFLQFSFFTKTHMFGASRNLEVICNILGQNWFFSNLLLLRIFQAGLEKPINNYLEWVILTKDRTITI